MDMSKVTLETLALDITYIKDSISDLKGSIVPKTEIDLRLLELQTDITGIRAELVKMEKKVERKFRWEVIGSNILTATLVSILSVLITYFVANVGG